MKILCFALIASLLSGCCGIAHLFTASHDHARAQPQQAPAANAGSAVYACPMHPEITASFATKCPNCGMDLVKREGQAPHKDGPDGEKPHDHDRGDDRKDGCGR